VFNFSKTTLADLKKNLEKYDDKSDKAEDRIYIAHRK